MRKSGLVELRKRRVFHQSISVTLLLQMINKEGRKEMGLKDVRCYNIDFFLAPSVNYSTCPRLRGQQLGSNFFLQYLLLTGDVHQV